MFKAFRSDYTDLSIYSVSFMSPMLPSFIFLNRGAQTFKHKHLPISLKKSGNRKFRLKTTDSILFSFKGNMTSNTRLEGLLTSCSGFKVFQKLTNGVAFSSCAFITISVSFQYVGTNIDFGKQGFIIAPQFHYIIQLHKERSVRLGLTEPFNKPSKPEFLYPALSVCSPENVWSGLIHQTYLLRGLFTWHRCAEIWD